MWPRTDALNKECFQIYNPNPSANVASCAGMSGAMQRGFFFQQLAQVLQSSEVD